jgi:hypothetical protein
MQEKFKNLLKLPLDGHWQVHDRRDSKAMEAIVADDFTITFPISWRRLTNYWMRKEKKLLSDQAELDFTLQ